LDDGGDDLLSRLDFLRVALGDCNKSSGVEKQEKSNATTNADADSEEVLSEFDRFDGNATNGGVDTSFSGDSTTGEVVAILFGGVFVERKRGVETGFKGVVKIFPPAVVAWSDGDARNAADLMTIGVFDLDFHDTNVSINTLEGETGVVEIGIRVK